MVERVLLSVFVYATKDTKDVAMMSGSLWGLTAPS